MWFVKDIGRGLDGVSIGRPRNRRYFSLEWIWSDRRVCFAFEGGDHWKRWGSIADEVLALSRERGGRQFLSYVFRTPASSELSIFRRSSSGSGAKTCVIPSCVASKHIQT